MDSAPAAAAVGGALIAMAVKTIQEAVMESPAFNKKPENAKAFGQIAEGSRDCAKLLRSLDYRDDHIAKVLAHRREQVESAFNICESPIECLMLAALVFADWRPFTCIQPAVHEIGKPFPSADLVVVPQLRLGQYRADFVVVGKAGNHKAHWICVECDGHEFHEDISNQQWEEDRYRDAWMTVMGVPVMRFPGSDIWKNPASCAAEVISGMAAWRAEATDGDG